MPYFDHNATAPLEPAARAAWLDAADRAWHNPSGLHAAASRAREVLEGCRERLADLLGASDPRRVVFTAGATAADNLLARHLGRVVAADAVAVISPIEHPAVAAAFEGALPGRVIETGCDADGVVTPAHLAAALDGAGGRTVACVSVMAAGNESGILEPWEALAAACRDRAIPFHTDAAQWLGKLPAAGLAACDWVTGSGHKFGGPRGVGFLLVPSGAPFRGDAGGPHEGGRHAGTENLPAIAGMVAALEAREAGLADAAARGAAARDAAIERLRHDLPGAVVVSSGAPRLWNTLALLVPGADSRRLVAALDRAGFEASTGSACSSGAAVGARVVAAITARHGAPLPGQAGMVRLSAGADSGAEAWLAAAATLAAAVAEGAGRPPRVALG
ncbi:MAG: cysteine desulfurase family protein [Planctomycetaceae bacterium]